MTTITNWCLGAICVAASSCGTLRPATVTKSAPVGNYRYIYVPLTASLSSSSGITAGGQYISSGKSVNPTDVISGIMTKNGFIRLSDLKPELSEQTLIVNYGESGKRTVGLGTAIEVTIQFVSASTNTQVCTCTAEGMGETEADDIRKAIHKCLNAALAKDQ